jgi:hypothetical protein
LQGLHWLLALLMPVLQLVQALLVALVLLLVLLVRPGPCRGCCLLLLQLLPLLQPLT